MLVNTELVAAVLISFVWARVSPYYSLPHKLMKTVKFWTAPPEAQIEKLLPKRHKRVKQKTLDLRAERMTSMPVEVEKLIDGNKHPIKDGMMTQLLQYNHLDTVLFVAAIVIALFIFSDARACVRGVTPDLVSSYGLLSLFVVCMHSLSYIIIRVGLGSQELQNSLIVALMSFVFSLGALFLPTSVVDFDFDAGLAATARSTESILKQLSVNVAMKPSPTALRLVLATFCGFLGAVGTLPAFRFARCYTDLTVQHLAKPVTRFMFHFNMFAPLLVAACFIKPLTGDLVVPSNLVPCNNSTLIRDCLPEGQTANGGVFQTESQWMSFRIFLVLFLGVVRIAVIRPFIQSYLSISKEKAVEQVVEVVGNVTNPSEEDVGRIKFVVTRVCQNIYQYICVAQLHVVSPALILISLALMLHRLGEVDLGICKQYEYGMAMAGFSAEAFRAVGPPKPSSLQTAVETGLKSLMGADISLAEIQVLPAPMMRAGGSFLIWWCCTIWFFVTCVGVVYWRMRLAGSLGGRADDDADEDDGEEAKAPAAAKAGNPKKAKGKKKGKKGKKQD